jgi:hypothetical protein
MEEAETGVMRNTTIQNSTVARPRQVLAAVRDDLRERRQARRAHRHLVQELSTYTTRAQVDDLLAALDNDSSAEAAQIRAILGRNLARNLDTITRHPMAS